jgi:hypothetical protein
MKSRSAFVALVLVAILVVAGFWFWRARQAGVEPNAVDLIELFPEAEKRTTMASLEEGFAIQTVSIFGDRKRSIFAHPFSRIIWTIVVPDGAVLRTAAALRPDSWTTEGDGAVFRVGVSDGDRYTNYVRQVLRPQDDPADRRWVPIEVDLSEYAGRQVKVVFNTEPGASGNAVADACVWGAPRIVPGPAATR